MLLYRGFRKCRGIFKSLIFKVIYFNRIKGAHFSVGRAGELLIIGDDSFISFGKNNVLRNNVSIRITGGKIILGNNTFINDNCCIVSRKSISIGDDCLIGQNVCIYDNNHVYRGRLPVNKQGFYKSEIKIGNNVWVGSNVTILPGVTIGDNVVIAAGSIVNKDIPSNSVFYRKSESVIKPILRDI